MWLSLFSKLFWFYLQHEDTSTLMASTIHTMAILLKQMSFWDDVESIAVPGLWPGVAVVIGNCVIWKFPLVVEVGSELFACCSILTDVLLEKCSPYAVAFPSRSVLLPWTEPWDWLSTVGMSFAAVRVAGVSVEFCVVTPVTVDGALDAVKVWFCGGLLTVTTNWAVGGSSTPCTSRRVMAWCEDPTAWFLSFRPRAASASTESEEGGCRRGAYRCPSSSTLSFWGPVWFASSASPFSAPELDRGARGFGAPIAADSTSIFGLSALGNLGLLLLLAWLVLTVTGLWALTNLCMRLLFTTSELGSLGWFTWLPVLTVFGVTLS